MTVAPKRVLSIGQCFADHSRIAQTIGQHFGAEVVAADSAAAATELMREQSFDLVLVNRVLDANGDSGLDAIRQLKADEALKPVAVMLVSNYDDAQVRAAEMGAAPGFGKAALGSPATLRRLEPWLGKGR
jgi:CheY-like chemotaxis protein